MAREEPRRPPPRSGVPERNDEKYLAHTLAYHRQGKGPRLEYRPVRITNWQPQARTY